MYVFIAILATTEVSSWMGNYMQLFWDVITYPFIKFDAGLTNLC